MTRVMELITDGTPWAIERSALETIITIARRENNLEAVLKQRGEPLDNTHKVEIRDGVALIPVNGPLFPRANLFGQISGAYSVEMLAQDLAKTATDPSVKAAILVFDSPGGRTTMINEFAQQIADYPKPITAYVTGMAASAAYWLAAAADRIVVDATAMVGNIGVVAAFAKDDKGIIEIVSSNAPDKRPDISTDAGRAVIQRVVDDMEAVFIQSVMDYQGLSRDQITSIRGTVLVGAQAVKMGFADSVGSLENVISELSKRGKPMDIQTLKAEHGDVYQAVFQEGINSAKTEAAAASSAAAKAERERISAIINHAEAEGRQGQAQALALETDLTPEAASKVLAASPKIAAASGDQFAEYMAKLSNPKIGADGGDGDDNDDAKTKGVVIKGWANAFGKAQAMNGGKR